MCEEYELTPLEEAQLEAVHDRVSELADGDDDHDHDDHHRHGGTVR